MKTEKNIFTVAENVQKLDIYSASYPQIFSRILFIRDDSGLKYFPGSSQRTKHDEKELIKAQLYVELVERCEYPSRLVELGRHIEIGGGKNKRYEEADVIVKDGEGNARMIFEVGGFDGYERDKSRIVRDLFDLAESLGGAKKPEYLIYFSRAFRNGDEKTKILVIDYSKFNTFDSWKKAGCPNGEMVRGRLEYFPGCLRRPENDID